MVAGKGNEGSEGSRCRHLPTCGWIRILQWNNFWTRYAKDKNHVFFDDAVIPPDPETFEIVQFTEGGATTIFDKNHIYQGENSKELQKYLKDKYGK